MRGGIAQIAAQVTSALQASVTDGLIACTDNHAQSLAQAVEDLSAGVNDHEITTYVVMGSPKDARR